MATRLETHQAPHREPWEMGCLTDRASRGESPLVGGRERKPIQGQGHLGNTSKEREPCPWAGEGKMPWRLSQRDTCWEAGPGAISSWHHGA